MTGLKINVKSTGTAAAIATLRELKERSEASDGWRVEATADYAGHVEKGTRYQPAQPYMAPAAQTVEANMMQHIARASTFDQALASMAFAVESEAKRLVAVDTGYLRSTIRARKL